MLRARNFRAQAAAAFAVLILVVLAALGVVVGIERTASVIRERTMDADTQDVLAAKRLELNAERMVAASRAYLLTGSSRFIEQIERAEAALGSDLSGLSERGLSEEGQAHLERIRTAANDYTAEVRRFTEDARSGSGAELPWE